MPKFKLVIDTSTLIAAWISSQPSYTKDLLQIATTGYVNFYMSAETFEELQEVSHRDYVIKSLKQRKILLAKLLSDYSEMCEWIDDLPSVSICREPKDNKFLALSEAVNADFLVTVDKDLLDLKKHQQTLILRPSQAWEKINKNLK